MDRLHFATPGDRGRGPAGAPAPWALVVASHVASRTWLARRLQPQLSVLAVGGAREALDALEADRGAVLIVCDLEDLGLPPIDFLWTAARLAPQARRLLIAAPGGAGHRDAVAFVESGDLIADRPCSTGQLDAMLGHLLADVAPAARAVEAGDGVVVPAALVEAVDRVRSVGRGLSCWFIDVGHTRRVIGEQAWAAGGAELVADTIYRTTSELFGGTVEVLGSVDLGSGAGLVVAHPTGQADLDGWAFQLQVALDSALLPVMGGRHDGLPRSGVAIEVMAIDGVGTAHGALTDALSCGRAAAAERHRRTLDGDRRVLASSIERGLEFVFQPVIDFDTAEVHGYEALLRGPLLSPFRAPTSMVALAGEVGLLPDLYEAAVMGALTAAADLDPRRRLFINVPACLLLERARIERVARWTVAMGLVPAQVVFEVAELGPFREGGGLRRAFEPLASIGFGLAITDLGTGDISLDELAAIRPDAIKLPISLVRGVAGTVVRRELVRALVRVARAVDACVLGAGVENAADLALLCDLGVRYAQGYFFAPPRRGFGGIRETATAVMRQIRAASAPRAAPAPGRAFDEQSGELDTGSMPRLIVPRIGKIRFAHGTGRQPVLAQTDAPVVSIDDVDDPAD